MTTPRIVCWADCGPGVGLGHVARSASIAGELLRRSDPVVMVPDPRGEDMIRAAGVVATVASFEALVEEAARCDAVLLDSYRVNRTQTAAVRAAGPAVAVMDDTAIDVLPADLIVNGAPGAERLPYDRAVTAEFLIGARYFPLQRRFRGWAQRVIEERVSRVVVTVGGEDVHGLLGALLRSAHAAFPDAEVIGVCGEAGTSRGAAGEDIRYLPPDYADLVRSADAMICGAGQTLVEAAATGTPSAALALGDDQRPQLRAVASAGACLDAGAWDMPPDVRERHLEAALSAIQDATVRGALSRAGRSLVDGAGATRIADALVALAQRREACR